MNKEFHHIGIPTTQPQPNEIYLASIQLYITDATQSPHRIEWTRAEPGCPFPEVFAEMLLATCPDRDLLGVMPTFSPFKMDSTTKKKKINFRSA